MANAEDNFLPVLVRYAAEKVRSSEVFLRLLSVCIEFNQQNRRRYRIQILVEKLYYHLQSGNLEFIAFEQRLQIHYVLEVPVPEQLRHPQAKFDKNGRLLEFSGELRLGEPNFAKIFEFLGGDDSWIFMNEELPDYDRETPSNRKLAQLYLKWREGKMLGPVGEEYLVQKFEAVRQVFQYTEALTPEDKIRVMMWIDEPLVNEEVERSIKNFGRIELEGRRVVAYIPNNLPEVLSLRKTYNETPQSPLRDVLPPATLNPVQLLPHQQDLHFNAQRLVSPDLPSPGVPGSEYNNAAGNNAIAHHMNPSCSFDASDFPPAQYQSTCFVSRKSLFEALEMTVYTAAGSDQSDELAIAIAQEIREEKNAEMVPTEHAEKELLKALESLLRESQNNGHLDWTRSLALARMVTSLDNFNIHAENVLFPNFSTAIQNARKTDGYAIRRILKDNAYNILLGLLRAWKSLNL